MKTPRDKMRAVLRDPPVIHREVTEIAHGSQVSGYMADEINRGAQSAGSFNYGVSGETALYLFDHIARKDRTLETGCGLTTLAFAIAGTDHTAVTADPEEPKKLAEYAAAHDLDLDSVKFITEPSETALPRLDLDGLDVVLLDGKHAFPWPFLDWFYTADRLRKGGTMYLDDANMRSVSTLVDFLNTEEGRWRHTTCLGTTEVFEKTADSALDVAWRMQPWTAQGAVPRRRKATGRMRRAIRHVVD